MEPDDLHQLWRFLARETAPRRSDVIFAFGSADLRVAHRAFELYAAGVAPCVLVSGGTVGGFGPQATEADAYSDALQARGVPCARIVVEHRASNTGENVTLGMAALAAHGITVRRATLVAFPTSLRRCAATFAWQHPRVEIDTVAAFEQAGPFGSAADGVANAVLAEVERLTTYPGLGHVGPQPLPSWVAEAADRVRAGISTPPAPVFTST